MDAYARDMTLLDVIFVANIIVTVRVVRCFESKTLQMFGFCPRRPEGISYTSRSER